MATPTRTDGTKRILEAAIRSFADLGYEGTTTAGVARAAGVTQPLVHHHFGSKEGLWRAAMDDLFSEVSLFTSLDRSVPPVDALLGSLERLARVVIARPEFTRVIAREGATKSERLTYLVEHSLGRQLREITGALGLAQQQGLVEPGLRPDLLVYFLIGAVTHVFDAQALAKEALGIDMQDARTREEFIQLALSIVKKGVLRGK